MKFKDLKFENRKGFIKLDGGIQSVIFFNNGYGASIIKGFGTYGNEEGLYELAIIKGNKDKFELCFDTEITDDVIGYLDEKMIDDLLLKIEKL